ncbi:DUF72 domain-containing protein [Lysobacter sp. A6]|uniref:DUF72 domain-containing protein n=1 Tax=Noviluteimonas lactosilytica TaxID=2888523 RepID=A0ABS8JKA2_9GAMM|nr:DUF72 domain-containing protein [Lysobacter lactosilyticus]MCC8363982.1 DUF72 domain-containing protein [Lysobacter lactosilyticus]
MIRIGISGWRYAPWRGVFYPPGLPQKRELEYAARLFPSIEINGSFYSLQSPASWQAWHDATPGHFVFAVKGPRFVTHILRLRGAETALANFFASGVLLLRRKLGPMLWQFPPNFRFDAERFATFFAQLPRTLRDATALAERHDQDRMRGRHAWPEEIDAAQRIRHCIEIRHPSFETPAFIALLREHDIGLVVADTAGKWPLLFDVTSDFVYMRLHGDEALYVSGYSDAAIGQWANRMRDWADAGLDLYCYFDNDVKVHAPFDAHALMRALGADVPIFMPDVRETRAQLPYEARTDTPAGLRR